MKGSVVLLVVCVALVIVPLQVTAQSDGTQQDLTCPNSTTLVELVECIYDQSIPENGTYIFPVPFQRAQFRTAVNEMMQGNCSSTLPANLALYMQRRPFTDAVSGRTYCLLMEVKDYNNDGMVDKGWGTFITYNGAVRQMNIMAPHIKADLNTHTQAIRVFRDLNARSFLMAGAHRDSDSTPSICMGGNYPRSDVVHDIENMMYAGTQELKAYYGTNMWYQIQFHGKQSATCDEVNVVLADGFIGPPTAKVQSVYTKMHADNPLWTIDLPETGYTCLQATENVMGRLLNDVPENDICDIYPYVATSASGKFVHIEASPNRPSPFEFRFASRWIPALRRAWPLPTPPCPVEPCKD